MNIKSINPITISEVFVEQVDDKNFYSCKGKDFEGVLWQWIETRIGDEVLAFSMFTPAKDETYREWASLDN